MERFHIAQTTFFLVINFVSHLIDPSEQFGTHENFFCEGVQGMSN